MGTKHSFGVWFDSCFKSDQFLVSRGRSIERVVELKYPGRLSEGGRKRRQLLLIPGTVVAETATPERSLIGPRKVDKVTSWWLQTEVPVRTGNESAAAVQEAAETVLDNWPRVVENVREARSPRDNTPHAVS
ncbi:hypothetical protein HZH66_004248 [Vespula vulgaris]|uniref:Uncharacterized protein n=1 Tax=Vespula vulgaris TaxID=7454 RepID=A0A834KG65_VESVU|nr:hypothetical protein HZH66_004248 [Vespula vulgaris]